MSLEKEQKHGSASASEYANFAADLSGENQEPNGPNMTILKLITMIRKADDKAAKDEWAPLVNRELVHIKAALQLISDNVLFQVKYGQSFKSAMELVGILKNRASEMELNESIEPAMKGILDNMKIRKLATSRGVHAPGTSTSSSSSSRSLTTPPTTT